MPQHAASFYLLLDERVREEAHRVAAIVTGGRSPQYRDLDPAVEREQLQRGRQFAVVSYLHRFGPVEDALVEAATADYGTPAGQRYVEAFSLAVAGSIQLAGLRVAGPPQHALTQAVGTLSGPADPARRPLN